MTGRRGGSTIRHPRTPATDDFSPRPHNVHNDVEMDVGLSRVPVAIDGGLSKDRKRSHYQATIVSPLARLSELELEREVREFHDTFLPFVQVERLLRAVRVAKEIRQYDLAARSSDPQADQNLPVKLTAEEKLALRKEKDTLPSEPTMLVVILTVSLAAFLQGFVQSSINGASLFPDVFGLAAADRDSSTPIPKPGPDDWKLGAVNASPFLSASFVGCWLALPINDRVGRRGAMAIAACLILASSLGSAWCTRWETLFGVRIINGIGMGIKAVSTPILASETAVGYWRGTSILAWQLWVAFGIAMGFAFNLIFFNAKDGKVTVQLILGAPFVPAIFLLCSLYFCPESPRYYMRRGSHFNPQKAYEILVKLRTEEFQALRDIYLIYKSVQQEERTGQQMTESQLYDVPIGLFGHFKANVAQYRDLFTRRRLRNALISSSTVALAQQLCGINVLAFYSGRLFSSILGSSDDPKHDKLLSLGLSLVFGAINFIFALPAIRTIDTLGRRKWLVLTLPVTGIFMTIAAFSTLIGNDNAQNVAQNGCAFAISINLGFAGLLSITFPSIFVGLKEGGTLGLFAGLNFLALALVFLLVEETKGLSLEDLDSIFNVHKSRFVRYQVFRYLPWLFRRYILGRDVDRPELYLDLIWGLDASDNEKEGEGEGGRGGGGLGLGLSLGNNDGRRKLASEGVLGRDQGLFSTTSPFSR
ncbi:hypothetical protein GGS20DRAFT_575433 [Poronia punctata]|nr:hypothetical protein GGS20DRAFT_575433 [Poronia punctata]